MPRGNSTGATKPKYTLDDGVWKWKVLPDGEAFRKQQFTEEGMTTAGDDKIQLVVKVGDSNQSIVVLETLTFNAKAEWKRNEFLKSAGIYAGEGVEYFLTAEMCIGLSGMCRTVNKEKNGYTNTHIAEFLEFGTQHPESIPGFLMSDVDNAVEVQTTNIDETDPLPFK